MPLCIVAEARSLRVQSVISMSSGEGEMIEGEASARTRGSQKSSSGARASFPRRRARSTMGWVTMSDITGRSEGSARMQRVMRSTNAGDKNVKSMIEKSFSRIACQAAEDPNIQCTRQLAISAQTLVFALTASIRYANVRSRFEDNQSEAA